MQVINDGLLHCISELVFVIIPVAQLFWPSWSISLPYGTRLGLPPSQSSGCCMQFLLSSDVSRLLSL